MWDVGLYPKQTTPNKREDKEAMNAKMSKTALPKIH
ncbi:hypothetical protein ISN45_At02g017100 [Arabidopsis thaliana x Arabidopsis arenosa]|uniref:Uncharacterized protein n=2 Tax=Arabidopsis TaxID=3701 RepID=A0A8T2FZF9_ARASU|nr:hypothetical protein ISN45_At02g017100 [Arabidopsis thaliana x Arabidopsis arenosa]KAG7641765.1 hypothetical protein ISN44_As02g017530 [Arabidopsis suecica]